MSGVGLSGVMADPAVAATSSASAHARPWFHDPVTAAARRAELAVPADPSGYSGSVRQTTATFRTADGAVAVPISWATGHTVVGGEAFALTDQSLFVFNSPIPTATAVVEVRHFAAALGHVRTLTCEGYTDYGGYAGHQQTLSLQRAQAICRLVHADHRSTGTRSFGYGGTDPVVVGGGTADRAQNRRVDIMITASASATAPHLMAVAAGDRTATITWAKPSYNGGRVITGYRVTTDGGKRWEALATTGSGPYKATVSGLTDGTTYPVAVRAAFAGGHGPASNRLHFTPRSSVHAPGVPGVPTLTATTPGDTTATLTFSAPTSDGGATITGYEASTNGGATWMALTTAGSGPYTATLHGLTDGTTYAVTVRAVNVAGDSAASNTRDVTPIGPPSAPVITAGVTAEFAVATLTFTPPASDGGSPITGYQYSEDGGAWTTLVVLPGSPLTTNIGVPFQGYPTTTYTFVIRAVNSAGPGLDSNPEPVVFNAD